MMDNRLSWLLVKAPESVETLPVINYDTYVWMLLTPLYAGARSLDPPGSLPQLVFLTSSAIWDYTSNSWGAAGDDPQSEAAGTEDLVSPRAHVLGLAPWTTCLLVTGTSLPGSFCLKQRIASSEITAVVWILGRWRFKKHRRDWNQNANVHAPSLLKAL